MSTSLKKNGGNAGEKLVAVETAQLKERLNRLHKARTNKAAQTAALTDLWDLKELALLEGKPSVEVPRRWLDELDGALEQLAKPN
jgi:hypothetical protein